MTNERYSTPVKDLIRARTSWRSYDPRPLENGLRQKIQEYLKGKTEGPFGHRTRFRLIEKDDSAPDKKLKLGTYGFIKNARSFIVGSVLSGARHWEDYGYLMEDIVLKMTDLGLGTCWLGGTYRRSEFRRAAGVSEEEVIPAVTPVGYRAASRSIRDRIIRRGARSHSRRSWATFFFNDGFGRPLTSDEAGNYSEVLEMIRLAPSASNRQLWRIVRESENFHLFLQRKPGVYGFNRSADLQRVDMGIAMCHLELTARESGLNGRWENTPPQIDLPDHTEYIVTWQAL